jgi:SAM-dependent methyltransferase
MTIRVSKHIKRRVVRWLANQLVNDLSELLPPMMAGDMAANMGMTTTFGPPVKRNSLGDAKSFVANLNASVHQDATSLDLGCGAIPQNPFQVHSSNLYGVDIRPQPELNVKAADLAAGRIPFPDVYFDCVTAHDFIEHVPRVSINQAGARFPFVELMNDIHRVLKPDGYFLSQTPAYPSLEAFQDPTHVNFITLRTFPVYFCQQTLPPPLQSAPAARMYGFSGTFELVGQETAGWLFTLLQKRVTT